MVDVVNYFWPPLYNLPKASDFRVELTLKKKKNLYESSDTSVLWHFISDYTVWNFDKPLNYKKKESNTSATGIE